MADNPFVDRVNQLDGVQLSAGQIVSTGDTYAYAVDSDTLISTYAGYNNNQALVKSINVIDANYYLSAFVNTDGENVPPVFGKIEVIFDNVDPISPDVVVRYYIRGFASTGEILLSRSINDSIEDFDNTDSAVIINVEGRVDTASTFPITFETNPAAICFAEGTRIDTADGPVAVETLQLGDRVMTASGASRPVRWIGQQLARPIRHSRPWQINPIRVQPHAFGDNMPTRPVRLSPGHAVYVDGVLVPVGHLVNGATIIQEQVESIRYFHIELESHDVVLAEGLPCETYLDDGNRAYFHKGSEVVELHGRLDPKSWDDACAPMVAAGPQLIALRQRLDERAMELGWVKSEDPVLRIVADDVKIAPAHIAGNRFWFAVPAAQSMVLRSNCDVLAHVMPALTDQRRLGVAVSALLVNGVALDLEDAVLGSGFYATERHGDVAWRWTDGAAALVIAGPAMIEVQLTMVAPSWQQETAPLRAVA